MEKIELPNEFKEKGIFVITVYDDEKGTFLKCTQGIWKRIFVQKINNEYKIVEDIELLKYLKEKYDIQIGEKEVVF